MERAGYLRREDDSREVVTLGVCEGDAEAIDSMRDDPHWMAGEERRLARIAPLEHEIVRSGVFEMVEELQARAGR